MTDFFSAYKALQTRIPTYFIESTAPENVDDAVPAPKVVDPNLDWIDSDAAVREIAAILAAGQHPNLVVMVHGFNNPEPEVLRTYTAAAEAIHADTEIKAGQGLVCVGYRWPSEKMGQPIHGTWDALPTLPTWILYWGCALTILPFLLFFLLPEDYRLSGISPLFRNPAVDHAVTMAGLTFAGLVLTAALLRTIVYFRDNYRATNYGVPDLVQIIRAIDGEIVRLRGGNAAAHDIELSFIGHSMGGFVVTNTIRVLSDVFEKPVRALNAFGAGSSADDAPEQPSARIGNVFVLKRFVLASPDIPAETLLSSRGNFLASALARFEEAYLFSNEGDEVLRQISTLANYFVFPTKTRNHGFRLGNVEILSSEFGVLSVAEPDFLRVLRIGSLTLQQLYDALERARFGQLPNAVRTPAQTSLPKVFTYFDCTDYVEPLAGGGKRSLLTFAKCRKAADPDAKLRWYSHLFLLGAYVLRHQKPNVHGGYFEGALSQQLIYRLACLGYKETLAAYGGEAPLSQICKERQIRVLLSPQLARTGSPLRASIQVLKPKPAKEADYAAGLTTARSTTPGSNLAKGG